MSNKKSKAAANLTSSLANAPAMNDEDKKLGIVSQQLIKEFSLPESNKKKLLPSELFQLYRQRASITQENLAKLLGLSSRRAVQAWENGESLPSAKRLQKLIEIYVQKKLFATGYEQEEARRLWNSVKDMHDTATTTLSSYVPFDHYWFEKLLVSQKAGAASEQVTERPSITPSPRLTLLPPVVTELPSLTIPNNLPAILNRLIGRTEQLEAIQKLLATADTVNAQNQNIRLLTITGPGGIGKTRLALEVAHSFLKTENKEKSSHSLKSSFKDGIIFCDLANLQDPEQLLPTLSRSLNVLGWEENNGKLNQLKTFLQEKQLLLVLDNFEQLVEAAPLLNELLRATLYLKFLVTSRENLNLYGEYNYRLAALQCPKTEIDQKIELVEYGALELFVERLRQHKQTDFQPDSNDLKIISQICRELDGLPLAIELAAAPAALLSLQEVATKLQSRFKLLRSGARDWPARHRTLEATLDWGYNLLNPNEQFLFCQLALFNGIFNFEAVVGICLKPDLTSLAKSETDTAIKEEKEEKEEEPFLELLTALLNKSMVAVSNLPPELSQRNFGQHYILLSTVREYGLKRLRSLALPVLDLEKRLRSQHANYFYKKVAQTAKVLAKSDWLDLVTLEQANLHQALEWFLHNPTTTLTFHEHESNLVPAVAGLRLALLLTPFWSTRGYPNEGRKWLGLALDQVTDYLALQKEDKEEGNSSDITNALVEALCELAGFEQLQSERNTARQHLEKALHLTNQNSLEQHHLANIYRQLGLIAYQESKYEEARTFYNKSLAIGEELKDKTIVAANTNNIGVIALEQGNYSEAIALFEKSLALRRELGDKQAMSAAFANLAIVAHNQGHLEEARTFYEESLILYRTLGNKYRVAAILNNLGSLAIEQANYEQAASLLSESYQLRRELGDRRGMAVSLSNLGYLFSKRGEHHLETALLYYKQSLAFRFELEEEFVVIYSFIGLMGVFAARQQWQAAIILAGAVDSLREKLAITEFDLNYREDYRKIVATARNYMETADFSTAWQIGKESSLSQLVERVLNNNRTIAY